MHNNPTGRRTTTICTGPDIESDKQRFFGIFYDSVPSHPSSHFGDSFDSLTANDVRICCPSSTSAAITPADLQLRQFVDPETGVYVVLVGALRYRLTEATVETLGMANQPGSVIVGVPAKLRWNKPAEMYMH